MIESGPLICIVGPTASGKSAVAEQVALLLHTDVVSIDAMQVYEGMDIGTAKTPLSERRCTLHMVDVCTVTEQYSVERFQADARSCIDALLAAGTAPVLCGGTGLYLNAVIDEMDFPKGQRGDSRRERYEELLNTHGALHLHSLLQSRDPKSASAIHPNNARRTIRALEMLDEGLSYADSLKTLHERKEHYKAVIFGLELDREVLYRRIDERVDKMFEAGLVQEVEALVEQGLQKDSTAGQAIGYKEILAYLDGSISLDEAREQVKTGTRRYAKRQISWFKHDGRVRWVDAHASDAQAIAQSIIEEAGYGAL